MSNLRFSIGLLPSRAPDSSFAELRGLYEGDDRLRVPEIAFNAVLNRPEAI